jgi:glycosyltransferase involved in cell wall biosynthesis
VIAGAARDGRKRSLLAIAWYRPGTGLSRVLHSAFRHLTDEWRIDVAAIGYDGPSIEVDGLSIHPTNRDGSDVLGAYAAIDRFRAHGADVVLCFNDVWFMERYARVLRPHIGRTPLVAYVPLDGRFADPTSAQGLLDYDLLCLFTAWARDEFERAWERLGAPDVTRPPIARAAARPPIAIVPHGVDVETFRARPELIESGFDLAARATAKRLVFAGLEDAGETFIVLNANRPDPRKRIDLTLEGFASFARDKPPGVRLCLHHALGAPGSAEEVRARAGALGIADRLLLNPLAEPGAVPDDARLNLLYNACDAGVNTAMGEGWGLVSFEHGAAGAAQIVPRHSACGELWDGHALLVPAHARYVPDFSILELAEVAPADVAAALDTLYRDRRLQHDLARSAWTYTHQPQFRWEAVADRWRQALSTLP